MNRFLVTYVKGWSYLWQMNLLRVWGFADAADKVESFFSPANLFVQRWLPLFYVPSLVVVPLAVKGISAAEGAKIGAILGIYLHPSPTSLTSCNESTVFDFPILVLNIWHPTATSNLPSVSLVTAGNYSKIPVLWTICGSGRMGMHIACDRLYYSSGAKDGEHRAPSSRPCAQSSSLYIYGALLLGCYYAAWLLHGFALSQCIGAGIHYCCSFFTCSHCRGLRGGH